MKGILGKSINELEAKKLTYLTESNSYLVAQCFKLREKKLQDYSIEDFRIMIGQGICLDWLMPLALDKLKDNIFAEGDFYPGDLLVNVLGIDKTYWTDKLAELTILIALLEGSPPLTDNDSVPESVMKVIHQTLPELKSIKG
ncbi:hypothetical protein BH09BAC4_BH09BAC4_42620 [soil metagenome]